MNESDDLKNLDDILKGKKPVPKQDYSEDKYLNLQPDQWQSKRNGWKAIKWKMSWFLEVTLPTIVITLIVGFIAHRFFSWWFE